MRPQARARKHGGEVKQRKLKWITLVFALGAIMMLGACKKKVAPPPPPPPPPPAAPTASLTANPNTVEKGGSTTLTWETTNATDVSIGGIGAVQASGSQQVTPTDSTTYRLTAKGPGGTQEATARVTVTTPPPPPPPAPSATEEELFSQNVKDIFFDYDKGDIRADQQSSIAGDIEFLKQHPNIRFTVEGHCDERGSTEYNLALGDSRASAVRNALVQGGVAADHIKTISYGKEKPFCTESNEQCWQQNRRGHFVYQK
jgi:peptidoglycan-associated lipoprotein